MAHWLDLLPSHEKAKIRARCRSPEEYECLRERVKGPEDLEREMKLNESYANLSFRLETQPKLKEEFKDQVLKDIQEHGMGEVLEKALESYNFDIAVEENAETHNDQIVLIPEGNVSEKVTIKPAFSERYLSKFSR